MRNITHVTLKPSSSHTIFPHQLIAMPSFCYSHVCVCFHIMPYANCLGWTVLYVHVKYGIYINMYDASTQGVDECMINVHYHYVHCYYYISENAEKAQPETKNMLSEGNSLVYITVSILTLLLLCGILLMLHVNHYIHCYY